MSHVTSGVVPPVVSPPVTPPSPPARVRRYWPERLGILGVSLAVYVVALATPALYMVVKGEAETWPGFHVLLIGWTALFVGQFAWFANVFLVLAVIPFLLRLWITTAVVLLVGVVIASHTFALFGQVMPADEGGVGKMHLEALGIGVWFWFASFVVPLVGSLVMQLVAGPRWRKPDKVSS